jgi:hypothetical protein
MDHCRVGHLFSETEKVLTALSSRAPVRTQFCYIEGRHPTLIVLHGATNATEFLPLSVLRQRETQRTLNRSISDDGGPGW